MIIVDHDCDKEKLLSHICFVLLVCFLFRFVYLALIEEKSQFKCIVTPPD